MAEKFPTEMIDFSRCMLTCEFPFKAIWTDNDVSHVNYLHIQETIFHENRIRGQVRYPLYLPMRLVIFFVINILLWQPVSAQDYTVDHFSDENGLPQNSVKSIALESGYLWLATENGPVRYDGRTFMLFDKNSTGAKGNRIVDFKKDTHGRLYAYTEHWQLLPIEKGTIIRRPAEYDSVFHTPGYTQEEFYPASGLPNLLDMYLEGLPYIIPLTPTQYYKVYQDSIWLYNKGKETLKFKYKIPSQQRLFLFSNKLYYIDNKRQVRMVTPEAGNVQLTGDITEQRGTAGSGKLFWNYSTNDIFLAVNKSLYLFQPGHGNEITTKRILNGVNLETADVLTLHYDRKDQKVFVGTSTNGLYIYTKRQFQTLGQRNYYAQYALDDNMILFSNGDLAKHDGTLEHMESVRRYGTSFSLLVDQDKNIWTYSEKSVHCLSPDGKKKLATIDFPYNVTCLYQSTDKMIWVGTSGGIFRLKKGPNGIYMKVLFSKVQDVTYLLKDGGILWVGTSHGLFRKNMLTQKLVDYRPLRNKHIRNIHIRKQQAWVTTYGDGLYLVSASRVKRIPPDRNNYLNSPHCILEDKQGFFWISTNKGLFKASPDDMAAYADDIMTPAYYQFYNKDFGFNTNEFNGGCQPCASIASDGRFIYPTIRGAVAFMPSAIVSSFPDKEIVIDKIEVDERSDFKRTGDLTLSQGYNKLTFHFSSPYFGRPENLNFQYRLDDDNHWRPAAEQAISYTSLPAGSHKLQIRKLNGFGPDNFTYKTLSITILPYFYETWWFKSLLAIAVLAVIYMFIRLRTMIIRKRNEQLEKNISERTTELMLTINAYESAKGMLERQSYFQRRLITAITHDVKSPLKYLMKTAESLYKNNSDDEKKDGLKAISYSSFQMYHFMDNILEYARGFVTEEEDVRATIDISELVARKTAIFHHLAASHNTRIINEIPAGTLVETNPQLLTVILHNLLDNAVKFTVSGEVVFSCTPGPHGVTIRIKDNGAGLTTEQAEWFNSSDGNSVQQDLFVSSNNGGLGLIMIKEMAYIMGVEIRVESRKGWGTIFEILIEAKNNGNG